MTSPDPAPPTPPAPPAWRPPSAWRPPPADRHRNGSLVIGLIFVVVGAWFFASRTLGLDLPDLDWGHLWPVILIAVGAWIVLGSLRRAR